MRLRVISPSPSPQPEAQSLQKAMETLRHEEPKKLGGWPLAGLVSLPIIAFFTGVYTFFYSAGEEPFGSFQADDACIISGGALLVIGIWLCWGWLVWRHRLEADVWVPVLLWAAATLFLSSISVISYFQEPWTYLKPLW